MALHNGAASGGILIRPLPPQWARAARLSPSRRAAGPARQGAGLVVGLPARALAPEPAPLGDAAFIAAGNALAAPPAAGRTLFGAEDVRPDPAAETPLPPGLPALPPPG